MQDAVPDFEETRICQYEGCDVALPPKSGKGRPPIYCEEHRRSNRSGNTSTASKGGSADAKKAADSIDQVYSLTAVALMFAGLLQASSDLEEGRVKAREQNIKHLTANPKLAKRINKWGEGGGTIGFIATNVMLIAPVTYTAVREYVEKRAEVMAERTAAMGDTGATFPGAPFYETEEVPQDTAMGNQD